MLFVNWLDVLFLRSRYQVSVPRRQLRGQRKQSSSSGSAEVLEGRILLSAVANSDPIAIQDVYAMAAETTLSRTVQEGLLANDLDIDGDAIAIEAFTDPGKGTVSVESDGSFVYTPNSGFVGTEGFTYALRDATGALSQLATVTIIVTNPANHDPIAGDDNYSTLEATALSVTAEHGLLANDLDSDGGPLTVRSSGTPANGIIDLGPDGSFTYTPHARFAGSDTFTYRIADASGTVSEPATVTIDVFTPTRDPIGVDDSGIGFETDANTAITTANVLANDIDIPSEGEDGTLPSIASTVEAIRNDINGTNEIVASDTEMVTAVITPNLGSQSGGIVESFANADGVGGLVDFVLNDTESFAATGVSGGFTATGTWSDILVTGPTSTATIGARTIVEGIISHVEPLGVSASTNLFARIDISGTPPGGGTTSTFAQFGGNNDDDAVLAEILQTSAITIDTQFPVSVTLHLRVLGGLRSGVRPIASGSLNADFRNTMRFPVDRDVFVLPDGFTAQSSSASIVNNRIVARRGPEADGLSIVDFETIGTKGLVINNGDGTFHYDPNGQFADLAMGESGTDRFRYTVNDGGGQTDTAEVTINIEGVNDPPVAVEDSVTLDENAAITIDVLINDSDVDGDTLTVSEFDDSLTVGLVINNGDGTFSYSPRGEFNHLAPGEQAVDSFAYEISDGNGGRAVGFVKFTIEGINHPPEAVGDSATANEDELIGINVLSNDRDSDGDGLIVTEFDTSGTKGRVGPGRTLDGASVVIYDPDGQFEQLAVGETATDSFRYTIIDGNGGMDTAEVIVTIEGVNDPPVAVDDLETTDEDTPITIDVLANDSDVDGDLLTIIAFDDAHTVGEVTDNGDGTFTYDPRGRFDQLRGGEQAFDFRFTYEISDGNGGTDVGFMSIVVEGVNDPPLALDDVAETTEDAPVTIGVLANDSDVEGDILEVAIDSGPANGAAVVNRGGTITYMPHVDFHGTDEFTYSVHDGNGGVSTAMVTVTVLSPQQQIDGLVADIRGLLSLRSLNGGQANSLLSKLENIGWHLQRGRTNSAINQLGAFVNQVEAFVAEGVLTAAEGELLLEPAADLHTSLTTTAEGATATGPTRAGLDAVFGDTAWLFDRLLLEPFSGKFHNNSGG